MVKNIESKLRLIALGLLFLLPITINFGLDLFFGTPTYQETQKMSSKQKRENNNPETDQKKSRFITSILLILILLYSVNCIHIPIIKCSIIGSIVYLFIFQLNHFMYYILPLKNLSFLNIHIKLIQITVALICFAAMTHYSYRDQNLLK